MAAAAVRRLQAGGAGGPGGADLPDPGGVAAALLVSLYLLIAASFKVNVNELYAGQGIEDFKSFLRMRFAPDGTLSIYVVGIDKISKKWVPQAAGSWFRPATALKPRLVDEVITLGPAKQHAAPPAVLPSDAEDPSHTA
ncbi:hypothetical protein ACFQZ4_52685 [Catellatospora coxensis]